MRRTLALLGAAALAVVGVAGPANASDPGIAQANVSFERVEPGTSTDPTDSIFELRNLDTVNAADLEDHSVLACVGPTNTTPIQLLTYAPDDEIPADDTAITADPNFSGAPDFRWDMDASGDLVGSDFDIRVFFDLDGTPAEVAKFTSGSPNGTCTAVLDAIA